jgi:hypothetical protein
MFTTAQHLLLTSEKVQTLARRGLHEPKDLSLDEIREMCGSVLEHLQIWHHADAGIFQHLMEDF